MALRGNIRTPSMARWKARGRLYIRCNWTFFAISYGWDVMSGNRSKTAFFEGGWVTLSADSRGKGASPTNHCWCQKTRAIAVSCGIRISAVLHSILSQYTGLTDRQTDRQNCGSNTVRCIRCSGTVIKLNCSLMNTTLYNKFVLPYQVVCNLIKNFSSDYSALLWYNQFEQFQPPHPAPARGGSSKLNETPEIPGSATEIVAHTIIQMTLAYFCASDTHLKKKLLKPIYRRLLLVQWCYRAQSLIHLRTVFILEAFFWGGIPNFRKFSPVLDCYEY